MFFNNIKAKLRRLADVSAADFLNLLQWGNPIDTSNANLLIASATDGNGPVVYTSVEPTFIVDGYAFRPNLSNKTAGIAGDVLYSTIASEAKTRGVGKVLVVLPNEVPTQPDEKWIRIVELKVQQTLEVSCHEQGKQYEHPAPFLN